MFFCGVEQELKCPGLWAAHTVQVCCQINSNSDQNEVITRLRKKITFRFRIVFEAQLQSKVTSI